MKCQFWKLERFSKERKCITIIIKYTLKKNDTKM